MRYVPVMSLSGTHWHLHNKWYVVVCVPGASLSDWITMCLGGQLLQLYLALSTYDPNQSTKMHAMPGVNRVFVVWVVWNSIRVGQHHCPTCRISHTVLCGLLYSKHWWITLDIVLRRFYLLSFCFGISVDSGLQENNLKALFYGFLHLSALLQTDCEGKFIQIVQKYLVKLLQIQ